MAARNPFRPSFGTTPPLLVGRDTAIASIGDALDAGPGAPGRATLYTGARGVGKTVMLNEAEAQARERGWVVASETANRGLINRLVTEGLPQVARQLDFPAVQRRITGLTLPASMGGVDLSVESRNQPGPGLRTQLNSITDYLDQHNTGLMITVDEIHGGPREELQELGAAVQHCFREERPLAFVAAGLPNAIQDLLTDQVLTFLRRADRQHLGAVDSADVADALRDPIEASEKTITDAALQAAVEGTGGYPFLIQLIGHWIWSTSGDEPQITREHADQGVNAARRRMGSLIHAPSLQDLSAVDRTFLAAMAHDTGPSKMKNVVARMGVSDSYASQYRLRLIAADMITPAGHGWVRFNMPYLRDYLREHAATLEI